MTAPDSPKNSPKKHPTKTKPLIGSTPAERQSLRQRFRFMRSRRFALVMVVLLTIGLVVFAEIIRPDQDARAYTARLQAATTPLEKCFDKLTETTQSDIFYAPDIAIADRQANAAAIRQQVDVCRSQLTKFDDTAHQLLNLHFSGYTQTYHQAKVNQRQAFDVVGQSNDVLDQYGDLADTLTQYYAHIKVFLDVFQDIQDAEKFAYPTRATVQKLAADAKDMHQRAGQIRQLKAAPTFDGTKLATASMFDDFATGLDNAVTGYTNYSDYYKSIGFKQVDKAVAYYDSTVVVLPFEQLKQSYVPKQVQQLPVKVKNLLAAQRE